MSDWIPVSERLPEKNETVLFWYKHWQLPYDTNIAVGRDPGRHGRTVTHWKPLPEPPRGEGNE